MGSEPDDAGIVSERNVDWTESDHDDRQFRRKRLGAAAGGEELGASLYEVPPGNRTWLAHYHTGNEEALYVLDGDGTVTLGPDDEEYALAPGDYVALPVGEAGKHEIRAGEETLRMLAISTMNEPDITVYPDDGKVGLYAGSAPGGDRADRTLSKYLDAGAEVDYWK